MIDYYRIPDHMRYSIRRYVEEGILPGRFLRAVLSNDFVDAVRYADDENSARLMNWADFLSFELPLDWWGSEEKMLKYAKEKSRNKTKEAKS